MTERPSEPQHEHSMPPRARRKVSPEERKILVDIVDICERLTIEHEEHGSLNREILRELEAKTQSLKERTAYYDVLYARNRLQEAGISYQQAVNVYEGLARDQGALRGDTEKVSNDLRSVIVKLLAQEKPTEVAKTSSDAVVRPQGQ